jgi:mannitol-1-phosphate/altronate dehydrogenase
VGAFHRAHQAMFIDDVLARGFSDWAIRVPPPRSG